MILLDPHVWIWWVHADPNLTSGARHLIQQHESEGLGVNAISCWEVAKLVERKRLVLPVSTSEWMEQALAYPGVRLLELSPAIAIESTELPGEFHRDPADQILVATARRHHCSILTADQLILSYPHVQALSAR